MDGSKGIVHGGNGEVGARKPAGVSLTAQECGQAGRGKGRNAAKFLAQSQTGMEVFQEKKSGFRLAGKAEGGMFTGAQERFDVDRCWGVTDATENDSCPCGLRQTRTLDSKPSVNLLERLNQSNHCILSLRWPLDLHRFKQGGQLVQLVKNGRACSVGRQSDGEKTGCVGNDLLRGIVKRLTVKTAQAQQNEKCLGQRLIGAVSLLQGLEIQDGPFIMARELKKIGDGQGVIGVLGVWFIEAVKTESPTGTGTFLQVTSHLLFEYPKVHGISSSCHENFHVGEQELRILPLPQFLLIIHSFPLFRTHGLNR